MAPAPVLDVRLLPLADSLTADFPQETAGRGRFLALTPADSYHSVETFVFYRLTSLDIIRRADRDSRRMFSPALRELGRRSLPEMQLIAQLLSHFTPQMLNIGRISTISRLGGRSP